MTRAVVLAMALFGGAPASARAQSQTLVVFAAASLREPFTEIGRLLEQRRPGLSVTFNFGGSNALALQLGQGVRADVFASADERWMAYTRDSLHVVEPPRPFTANHVAVVVPRDNPARIARLQDLARAGVKIVVAADAVPVGNYTRQVLAKLSAAAAFGADFGARVQRNVVSREENVKAVVTKVSLGEADAGFVYRSDVDSANAAHVSLVDVPDRYNVLALYPIAVVSNAPNPSVARAFVDLVLSAEGQAILARHHFTPTPVRR